MNSELQAILRRAGGVQVLRRVGLSLRGRGLPQELRGSPAPAAPGLGRAHLLPPMPGVPVPVHHRVRPLHQGRFPPARLQRRLRARRPRLPRGSRPGKRRHAGRAVPGREAAADARLRGRQRQPGASAACGRVPEGRDLRSLRTGPFRPAVRTLRLRRLLRGRRALHRPGADVRRHPRIPGRTGPGRLLDDAPAARHRPPGPALVVRQPPQRPCLALLEGKPAGAASSPSDSGSPPSIPAFTSCSERSRHSRDTSSCRSIRTGKRRTPRR